jgi:hypothetical protein
VGRLGAAGSKKRRALRARLAKEFRKNLLFLKKKKQKDFCEFAAETVLALVRTDLCAKVFCFFFQIRSPSFERSEASRLSGDSTP